MSGTWFGHSTFQSKLAPSVGNVWCFCVHNNTFQNCRNKHAVGDKVTHNRTTLFNQVLPRLANLIMLLRRCSRSHSRTTPTSAGQREHFTPTSTGVCRGVSCSTSRQHVSRRRSCGKAAGQRRPHPHPKQLVCFWAWLRVTWWISCSNRFKYANKRGKREMRIN